MSEEEGYWVSPLSLYAYPSTYGLDLWWQNYLATDARSPLCKVGFKSRLSDHGQGGREGRGKEKEGGIGVELRLAGRLGGRVNE